MIGLLPVELWDYGLKDITACLCSALHGGQTLQTLHLPGLGDCIPARSARAALVTAIRALELGPGARIGIPLYCCPVVFKSIAAVGCSCRFVDIDLETYCMSAEDLYKKRREIDAVIAVHMFGNMCDMASLTEAAEGKPIIEDCAQSLGSRIGDEPSGSFGEIAAFSFRSGKYLSVGEGGALFAQDPLLRSRLKHLTEGMPIPSRFDELVHMAATYARSTLRRKPLYGVLGYPLWAAYNRKVGYADMSPLVLSQMYLSDFALTFRRLGTLDAAIAKQRANASVYEKALRLYPARLCLEKPGVHYNRYVYPILFPSSAQRDSMATYLHHMKIDTSRPYKDICKVAASYYGYSGDCQAAEQAAQKVLAIPSYHALGTRHIERIATRVNAGWASITRS